MKSQDPISWNSHAVSHVGTVRKVNEDACLNRPARGLWVVADGMGGHSAGDIASKTIVEMLDELPGDGSLATVAERLEECLREANSRLVRMARESDKHTIGSTVAALVIRGHHALCAWAGDSRVYRLRKGKVEQLTQDHAMVEDMVEAGLIRRDEAESHPHANRITRAIGATDDVFIDMEIHEVAPNDRFLLCSDGLYKELSEEEVGKLLKKRGDVAKAAVDLALERGARDNVTVVTVTIDKG